MTAPISIQVDVQAESYKTVGELTVENRILREKLVGAFAEIERLSNTVATKAEPTHV